MSRKGKVTQSLVYPLHCGFMWHRCVQNCPGQQKTTARWNNPGRVRGTALAKEKLLPFFIATVNVRMACVISTGEFAGNARPSPLLIHFLSLRRQDHHAGSHSFQVLILTAQGKAGPVITCLTMIGPGDRCPSIGEYLGCHLSVRNIGIHASKHCHRIVGPYFCSIPRCKA